MVDSRNADGRFTPEHTDEEILAAVRTHEPAATSEVAEEVGMTRQGTDRRLRILRDAGRVNSKKIGASLVWFAPGQDGAQATTDTAGGEPTPSPAETPGDTGTAAHGGNTPERSEPLAGVDFPGTVNGNDARDAIFAARDFLKKHGGATKADFVREIMRDYPLGYDPDAALAKVEAGERFRGAWWRRVIKPGLEALPDVQKPPEGGSKWNVTGGEK
jgi:hypothetical protein